MSDDDNAEGQWHTGLFARLDTSFPKKCTNCGHVFQTAEQYFNETMDICEQDKGLKTYVEDDTTTVVEAFRNCTCGSTLMETFDDHRDEVQAQADHKQQQQKVNHSVRVEDPSAKHVSAMPVQKPATSNVQLQSAPLLIDDYKFEFVEEFSDNVGRWDDAWYEGLRPIGGGAFPKECRHCGRIYNTPDDFFSETSNIKSAETGLQEIFDEDAGVFIEAFRNCSCGSTLMDNFSNRRDTSPAGRQRREKFDNGLNYLVSIGIDADVAYTELLKVVRGEKSEVLARIKPPEAKWK